jgi:hypothetical protein
MITPSKPAHSKPALFGIRASVWLLVLFSGLAVLLAICLPHPSVTKAPEQTVKPSSDVAEYSAPVAPPWNAQRNTARPVSATSEPMQKTLTGWVLDLESTNADVVDAARKVLADLGPDAAPAIPQLAKMLNEGRRSNAAAYTLAHIGTNALPVLIGALSNGSPYVRLDAAGAIGWFHEAGETAVPGLVGCVRDDDPGVRGNAIAALQSIPKRPDIAVPALIAALADPDASVHDSAATVLQKYAQVEAEATIPMLVQAAQQDQNPVSIRFRAAEIVRAIAPERAKAEGL